MTTAPASAARKAAMQVSGRLRGISVSSVPFDSMESYLGELFAGIFHSGRGIDLADDAPVFLIGDRHEAVLGLELGLQRRTLPREGEERLLDFRGERRIEIVRMTVAC